MPHTCHIPPIGALLAVGGALLLAAASPRVAAAPNPPAPASVVVLAVFDFELDDDTPAAELEGKVTSSTASLQKASAAARRILAQSGRYRLVDVSGAQAGRVRDHSLRLCNGCEAAIARRLGADQSLLGIVMRATQTDYYVIVQIRDARSGKLLDQQSANFAGSEDGWASGVRMLIQHQVLATPDVP